MLLVVFFVLSLVGGSVAIPIADVWHILIGNYEGRESWRFIVVEARLPQAIAALLCGAQLAVSGLLLQTSFHNALAGPDIFGISSGAALGAALVILLMGGSLQVGVVSMNGYVAVLAAAFVGAMVVTAIILFFSRIVRTNILLLIIGLMIGYLVSSAVSLLNFFATAEGVKSYMVWGMGSFSGVTAQMLPLFVIVSVAGLLLSFLMMKPLNAMLLGTQYAHSVGINMRRMRFLLLLVTGLQTATCTAFCGPVAFIGLAVPHIARMLIRTENHRLLLPATMLSGAVVALFCNVVCSVPADGSLLPLNAITPLIGAPVIIYILIKH